MKFRKNTDFKDKVFPTLEAAKEYGENASNNDTPKDMLVLVEKLLEQTQDWMLSMQTNTMLANESFYTYLLAKEDKEDKENIQKGRVI
jgi:hypothetical protein